MLVSVFLLRVFFCHCNCVVGVVVISVVVVAIIVIVAAADFLASVDTYLSLLALLLLVLRILLLLVTIVIVLVFVGDCVHECLLLQLVLASSSSWCLHRFAVKLLLVVLSSRTVLRSCFSFFYMAVSILFPLLSFLVFPIVFYAFLSKAGPWPMLFNRTK